MNVTIKTRLDQMKTFIKKHQTFVACSVTAVIVHRYTYSRTIEGAILGIADNAYDLGRQNGVLLVQNNVLREFIGTKGLNEEVLHFISHL